MLILDSTNKSLRVRLAAAHTTTALRCVSSWRDVTSTSFTPGSTLVSTNGTTPVELAPSPSASTQRIIDFVSIMNTDTVNHNVTIYMHDGTTNFDMSTIAIAPNERIEYVEGQGFSCYTSGGALKTLSLATQNVVSTGYSTNVLSLDVTNSTTTMANVTNLSFAVAANVGYWFQFYINYTANATTTGSRWSITGPTYNQIAYRSDYSLTTTSRTVNEVSGASGTTTAYNTPSTANASSASINGNIAVIEGYIQPAANGDVTATFASELSGNAIVAKAGSLVRFVAV